jgi:CheY-like chemotaxis protein
VLFVDDEEALTALGSSMLNHLGYKVTTQTSSMVALDLFRARPKDFDLVITDQTMPVLNGVELAQELLAIRPGIPIILYTGYSSKITEQKIIKHGFKGLLMKPFDIRQLSEIVRKALDGESPLQA